MSSTAWSSTAWSSTAWSSAARPSTGSSKDCSASALSRRAFVATIYSMIASLLVSVFPVYRAMALADGEPPDLDAYAARVMKDFNVPGMAFAVVKDGKVVLAKGYGIRRQGDSTPVNEGTLFGIGSNTKAFTCAALAILADEGKLTWDDQVIKHLPNFAMYDPYVTREMTIRDLVTHKSGLGLGASCWYACK